MCEVCKGVWTLSSITWPGVPEDEKEFKNQQYGDDLYTMADLDRALAGLQADEADEELDEDAAE